MLAAAGVLLVLCCAAGGAILANNLGQRHDYLAIAQAVPEGGSLTAADLQTVQMNAPNGVPLLASSLAGRVIGLRATEPLAAGSLLSASDLTTVSPLPSGQALVGASLDANQVPAGLGVGNPVMVVYSSTSGPINTNGSAGSELLGQGRVYALTLPQVDSTTGIGSSETVTLEVPSNDAAVIASASAAGDVSLAELSTTKPVSPSGQGG